MKPEDNQSQESAIPNLDEVPKSLFQDTIYPYPHYSPEGGPVVSPLVIKIKKAHKSDVPFPDTSEAFGYYNLYVDFTNTPYGNNIRIPSKLNRFIPTNIICEIPKEYELRVRSKMQNHTSIADIGCEIKGITIIENVLHLIVYNGTQEAAVIKHGHKIAEFTVAPILNSTLVIVE
jgi:dUTPase